MSSNKQQEINQPFIVNAVVILAIAVGGFYIFKEMPADAKLKLLDELFQNVRYQAQIRQVLNSLSSVLSGTEPVMQYYALLFIIKAFLFVEAVPLLVLAYVLSIVDTNIQTSDIFDVRVPSVTAFHTAKRLVPVCLLFLPFCYIAIPVETYLSGIQPRTILYSAGIVNAVLIYRTYYVMRVNRPPVM